MRCPSCKESLPSADAWICPYCEHIIDPSVFMEGSGPQPPGIEEGTLRGVAWDHDVGSEPELPEAIILGEGRTPGRQPAVLSGAGATPDGRTSTFLYYAASPSRAVSPKAVPRKNSRSTAPLTPYEDFLLRCVDGHRTVRHIRHLSGLAVEEVVVTLLTLIDKGAITLPVSMSWPPQARMVEVDDLVLESPTEPAAEGPEAATVDLPPVAGGIEAPTVEAESDLGGLDEKTDLMELDERRRSELAQLVELEGSEDVNLFGLVEEEPAPDILHEQPLRPRSISEPRLPPRDRGGVVVEPLAPQGGAEVPTKRPPVGVPVRPVVERNRPSEAAAEVSVASPRSAPPAMAAKAAKLFEVALDDQRQGNFVSARMNIKLALTFDPDNQTYLEALNGPAPEPPAPARDEARELYDAATEAEKRGDYDGAISLIEKALALTKQAAFYNRLGVLYAMRKLEYERAQRFIERAIEMSPRNDIYQRNLQKILAMAAAESLVNDKEPKRRSWLGFFRRK
ncbi:MAG: tetratricopeptide repeat protein [Myxococcota bacterium]